MASRVGIIGANGSGKSTLLRLLAGIYHPTTGTRKVVGKISSLFDLTLGFEMESNGWKNIRYRGYLQGESIEGLRDKTPEIAEFSELGEFLGLPLRLYSAGMLVRLAFSVATTIEPEILLIDEILGAGDLAFQNKGAKAAAPDARESREYWSLSATISALCQSSAPGVFGWIRDGSRPTDLYEMSSTRMSRTSRGPNEPRHNWIWRPHFPLLFPILTTFLETFRVSQTQTGCI